MPWHRRGGLLVYALITVLAIISLVVLFRLKSTFDQTMVNRVEDLQRVFSNRDLLKAPTDSKISFSALEAEAAKYENRGDFGRIRIWKNFGAQEHIVYPYYAPALQRAGLSGTALETTEPSPQRFWKRILSGETEVILPLSDGGQPLGTLQIIVNTTPAKFVSFVIWTLAALLATALTFLATQFRKQEKVISATTIELEEKRRELIRLERLALAGQLSANILHDLKKPVLNIRNEADEAVHPFAPEGHSAEPVPVIFTRIREQADFFLRMLKEAGFDRFVRAGEEREYVDLNELLDQSLGLVRYEQGSVQVEKGYSLELPAMFADPIRLIQIFSNLILNAYQALDGRGVVTVKTRFQEGRFLVEIGDSGPGIPAHIAAHIFEPFYTTKPVGQGTGLGLYIVKDIIEDMAGTIKLDTGPEGTTFRMTFPATAPGENKLS